MPQKVSFQDIPTECVPFTESAHGKQRRDERNIGISQLQTAMKHGDWRVGVPRSNGDSTSVYTHDNIVYVVNDVTGEEVTSYTRPEALNSVNITPEDLELYKRAKKDIEEGSSLWQSHTVVVVDTSGSMRKSDFYGARSRLKAVWAAIANDYLFPAIEEGKGTLSDVVTIVAFGDKAYDILLREPLGWVLYNKVCKIHQSSQAIYNPSGHGHYLPGLRKAEEVFSGTQHCPPLNLMFLSDGRPSDHVRLGGNVAENTIEKIVEELASKYGRRLHFKAIGIGCSTDFEVLHRMVDAAADHGADAAFALPSQSCASLGTSFTASATALATTQAEMVDGDRNSIRQMRQVAHESRKRAKTIPRTVSSIEYDIYPVRNIMREKCYEVPAVCKNYKRVVHDYEKVGLHHQLAQYVAVKKKCFGQGSERFAFQFYEVSADNCTVVGKAFTAKESCYTLSRDADKFARNFCTAQIFTRRIAEEFNQKLDSLIRLSKSTPRMHVLDCSIYHVSLASGTRSLLVEERLDHMKWMKWNSNVGTASTVDQRKTQAFSRSPLSAIKENGDGSDDDEVSSDESEDDVDTAADSLRVFGGTSHPTWDTAEGKVESHLLVRADILPSQELCFTAHDVAQAFSHFSYIATGRKRLICDIQGIFDGESNRLKISDPAIHYYNPQKDKCKHVHGRSDLGLQGMRRFLRNHQCSKLCSLVTSGLKHKRKRKRPQRHMCEDRADLGSTKKRRQAHY